MGRSRASTPASRVGAAKASLCERPERQGTPHPPRSEAPLLWAKAADRLGPAPTGKSEFGEVFLAKAQGLEEGVPETLVLVKSLQSRDEQQQLDFRREFEMFGKLNHANVVRLLGLCREVEPHYMVLEYVDLVRWAGGGDVGGGEMESRAQAVGGAPWEPPLTWTWSVCPCLPETLSLWFAPAL